jgi:hypothetical protein
LEQVLFLAERWEWLNMGSFTIEMM